MSEEKVNVWYPGHVQKAKRQIRENLKKIDIVIIVLDARTPVATTSFEMNMFKDKEKIILLNKSDLADERYNELWYAEISKVFPTMLVNKETNRKDLVKFIKSSTIRSNVHLVVVGVPNVGKSTIINKILGRHRSKTGAQPGITRGVQWISTDGIVVLDSPGILYSELYSKEVMAKLLLIGSIPVENLSDEIYEVAFNIYKEVAKVDGELYTFLDSYARKRGLLRKGGEADLEKARMLFFKELSEGKMGRYTYDTDIDKFWEVVKNG
ncbi:MAG: GTPase [Fervidobacterium sp.]